MGLLLREGGETERRSMVRAPGFPFVLAISRKCCLKNINPSLQLPLAWGSAPTEAWGVQGEKTLPNHQRAVGHRREGFSLRIPRLQQLL